VELIFAYGAGLLTLINPCVLPVIPLALASAASADRFGPVALAAGMSAAFTLLGVAVAAFGPAVGLTPETVADAGALAMVAFGAMLLTPRLNAVFSAATAGFAGAADARMRDTGGNGLAGHFAGGALLGAVWSPCIGPTLGGAIALASAGQSLAFAAGIMLAFSLGVSTIVLLLAYGARETIRARQQAMRALAERSKPIMGVAFVAIGLALWFRLNHIAEAYLLDRMPTWLQDLSVAI